MATSFRLLGCVLLALVATSMLHQPGLAQERLSVVVPSEGSRQFALSATGKLVVGWGRVAGQGIIYHVWDAASGDLLTELKKVQSGAHVSFSEDEKSLTTFQFNQDEKKPRLMQKRWDLKTGMEVDYREIWAHGIRGMSGSGKYMVTPKDPELPTAFIWDVLKRNEIATIEVDTRALYSAAFDAAEKLVVTGGAGGDLIVWELPKGKLLNKFTARPANYLDGPLSVRQADYSIRFVDFSPNGRIVVARDGTKTLRLWKVADGKMLAAIPKVECEECRFTRDGRFLITVHQNVVEFRSIRNGEIVQSFGEDRKKNVTCKQLMLSTDGRTLAFLSGREIHIWETPELK